MSLWRELTRGLHALTHRTAADRDISDEVEHFIEEATNAWRARGLSAEDAPRGRIVALVVRQGLTMTALGVLTGLIAAAAASRALVTLLFGVSPTDATTYLGVITLLFGVSALACWAPALRAAWIDPSITLRVE
jgi:hypothetical protein